MSAIRDVRAREILDSRGNPTVYAEVLLEDGTTGGAGVPSGASTGTREAVELRDGDPARFMGRGVLQAVANANGPLRDLALGRSAEDQAGLDRAMTEADGTENKSRYGANAILAVSMAAARAAAASRGVPLYRWLGELAGAPRPVELPVPMFNILNGGAHAEGSTDFQEFMVMPLGVGSIADAVRAGAEVYHSLRAVLHDEGLPTAVGDEGGFAPPGLSTRAALDYLVQAIEDAGYRPGADVSLALDTAASEFATRDETGATAYELKREGRTLSSQELVQEYRGLLDDYPIVSIEDGLSEDDWDGWRTMTDSLGSRVQIVGDDLLVTQRRYLEEGIKTGAANAILIKLNQVGTVTETLETIATARAAGWRTVVSHRSGETEDTTIADLAVGVGSGQIKTGAPARSDRVAKYNRLLAIAAELGDAAEYAGAGALR